MRPNWREDLLDLADGKDLVIIQEAVLHSDLTEAFDKSAHCTFAKGYKTKKHTTGVMTISKHEPVRRHQLTCWEPWLATPKCTNITEYALSDTEETLIVVNIHAINFTLGVKQFRKQIDKVRKELAKHKGPIILSGDCSSVILTSHLFVEQLDRGKACKQSKHKSQAKPVEVLFNERPDFFTFPAKEAGDKKKSR